MFGKKNPDTSCGRWLSGAHRWHASAAGDCPQDGATRLRWGSFTGRKVRPLLLRRVGKLLVGVWALSLFAAAPAFSSSPCTSTLCGIVVHLGDQRFDTYTAPSNDTQATDSTADVPLSIQRQWSFQVAGGNGQVGSGSIVAASGIAANLWNGPVPPFTATATPLGQFLAVSSGVTIATAAPGFSSSRTVSPLMIPPGGGTQVLTASFTVDSTGLSFVLLSLTPNQSADSWSFTSSSDPADTSSVNANPGGGLSISLNNPQPGVTYTFTFTGMVANSSAQPVPSKPFFGFEAVSSATASPPVIASSYTLPDAVLEGTVTYSFDGLYWLWPGAGSQFGVNYPNGPDPTSSGVACSPSSLVAGQSTTCTATVADTSGSFYASPPTGAVTWSTSGSGTFSHGGTCTLIPGPGGPAGNVSTCSVTYTPQATPANPLRTDTITATYNGDSTHTGGVSFYPGMGPGPYVQVISPTPDPTSSGVVCSPSTAVAGQPRTCTATVTDTSAGFQTPPTGTATWSTTGMGGFSGGGSCTLVPLSTSFNSASCSVTYTPTATPANPLRTDTITATYGGDSTHTGSVSFYPGMGPGPFVTVISPTALASGAFVIGDENATVGNSVTFWGSQWSALNTLSGGSAPASFKGFASSSPYNPPQCGEQWTADPGNSSNPPATIPQYMTAIVSSAITKSGSTIRGNALEVVVVKTNGGYASDPGHPGSGTVVATICHS